MWLPSLVALLREWVILITMMCMTIDPLILRIKKDRLHIIILMKRIHPMLLLIIILITTDRRNMWMTNPTTLMVLIPKG